MWLSSLLNSQSLNMFHTLQWTFFSIMKESIMIAKCLNKIPSKNLYLLILLRKVVLGRYGVWLWPISRFLGNVGFSCWHYWERQKVTWRRKPGWWHYYASCGACGEKLYKVLWSDRLGPLGSMANFELIIFKEYY